MSLMSSASTYSGYFWTAMLCLNSLANASTGNRKFSVNAWSAWYAWIAHLSDTSTPGCLSGKKVAISFFMFLPHAAPLGYGIPIFR